MRFLVIFYKYSIKITKYMPVVIVLLSHNGIKNQAVNEYEIFLYSAVWKQKL